MGRPLAHLRGHRHGHLAGRVLLFIHCPVAARPVTIDRISLTLLAVFIADVGVLYYRSNLGPLAFLRRHWLNVVMVIPYFRIFRVLRVVRFLRVLRLLQQPGPAIAMRLAKLGLNAERARKKARRVTDSLAARFQ